MNMKTRLALGILTALAMLLLAFALPRGGALRDAQPGSVSRNSWSVGDFRFAVREIAIGSLGAFTDSFHDRS